MTARRTRSSSSSGCRPRAGAARRARSSRSPVPRPCAAETAIGSPRPRPWKSCASGTSLGASILLAATITGTSPRRRMSATSSSPGRSPARASTTSSATCASASAARAWSWIETASGSSSSRSTPPVSMSVNVRPFHSVWSSLRSRVTPGPLVHDGLARLREPVDERGLADVRIADDRDLHRHRSPGPPRRAWRSGRRRPRDRGRRCRPGRRRWPAISGECARRSSRSSRSVCSAQHLLVVRAELLRAAARAHLGRRR